MSKIKRIINWQDKQKTPKELLENIEEEFNIDEIRRMVILYLQDDGYLYYSPAARDRDYSRPLVLWDLEQFKHAFVTDDWEDCK